jgi:hypothetical protein
MSQYFKRFILLIILIGCRDNPVDNNSVKENDPFSSLSKDSIIVPTTLMKSKIVFSFFEEITTTGRPIELFFNTVEIYPSGGYSIVGNVHHSGTNIEIQLDSVIAPQVGPGISVPASVPFNLGNLINNLYDITININGQKVRALFLVSDTSYILKIQPNNFIALSRTRLLRVPNNIIWGQAESISPTVYQQFIDSLIVAGAKPANILVGDYGLYFKIVSADSFYIPSVMGMRYGKYFLYEFNADTSVSRNLVKSFAKKYGDAVYIQLTGGRGEMYYTTVLKWEP